MFAFVMVRSCCGAADVRRCGQQTPQNTTTRVRAKTRIPATSAAMLQSSPVSEPICSQNSLVSSLPMCLLLTSTTEGATTVATTTATRCASSAPSRLVQAPTTLVQTGSHAVVTSSIGTTSGLFWPSTRTGRTSAHTRTNASAVNAGTSASTTITSPRRRHAFGRTLSNGRSSPTSSSDHTESLLLLLLMRRCSKQSRPPHTHAKHSLLQTKWTSVQVGEKERAKRWKFTPRCACAAWRFSRESAVWRSHNAGGRNDGGAHKRAGAAGHHNRL